MNFLKKKLKPLTSGSITTANLNQLGTGPGGQPKRGQTSRNNNSSGNKNRDLEDDLYDEYVIEAPPHPSELLALGVDPNQIDVNDPDKLRELYRKAIEEGKDKKTNSILLARQRQKEELEEKKRTREEWKFFDSLTSRVEEVVKTSQKNLDHWKESSTVDQLTEPEYELRQTADQVFKSVTTIKQEKGENDWIDFDEESGKKKAREKQQQQEGASSKQDDNQTKFDEFGCPIVGRRVSSASSKNAKLAATGEDELGSNSFVVDELLQDFGIDLRTEEQKRAIELKKKQQEQQAEEEERKRRAQEAEDQKALSLSASATQDSKKVDLKAAARPRPRPRLQGAANEEPKQQPQPPEEVDPFDTSFVVAPSVEPEQLDKQGTASGELWLGEEAESFKADSKNLAPVGQSTTTPAATTYVDPFDTSYVNL